MSFFEREQRHREMVETTGLELLVLCQQGIPLAPSQQDLTPLQRQVLLEAYIYQQREIQCQLERQQRQSGRRYR